MAKMYFFYPIHYTTISLFRNSSEKLAVIVSKCRHEETGYLRLIVGLHLVTTECFDGLGAEDYLTEVDVLATKENENVVVLIEVLACKLEMLRMLEVFLVFL